MQTQINSDGSFDLISPAGSIRNCWPSFDYQAIRCAKVDVTEQSITYHCADGVLQLTFHDDHISSQLIGFQTAPRWVQVISGASLHDMSSFFRQGIGFSGPTGTLDFERLGEERWSYESYLLIALLNKDEQVSCLYPTEHKKFLFRANIYQDVYNHNFRNREIDDAKKYFSCGFRTENIAINETLTLPNIYLQIGNGLFNTLKQCARQIADANQARVPSKPRYHYCSWYHHNSMLTEELFFDAIDGMQQVDPEKYMQAAQIDDGYCTSRGDWLTPKTHLWPQGLEPVFKKVQEAGYAPGIWVAPFMVGCSSTIATEHPDWLLHHADGSLVREWVNYHHGSPDFEHHILDTSHPDALAWIKEVFETMYQWGARVYKTDFLEWGYKDSTRFKRYTPGKTGAEYFDNVMKTIRAAIKDSYWLGCITYFAPSIGYMDGMRMTADVGVQWNKQGGTGNDGCGGGTENMIEESFATLYMNNVFWQNDPDVTFMREEHIHLSDMEIKSLAYYNGLMGHSVNTSCEIGNLSPERLKLWQWLRPQAEPFSAALPFFTNGHTFRVIVRNYEQENGWALLILNEHADERIGIVNLNDILELEEAEVFSWNENGSTALGKQSQFFETLAGHGHALYFISRDGKAPSSKLNLGGSVTN